MRVFFIDGPLEDRSARYRTSHLIHAEVLPAGEHGGAVNLVDDELPPLLPKLVQQ